MQESDQKVGTAEICDKYSDKVQVMQIHLFSYGGIERCCGRIETFRLHEDNRVLKTRLQSPGNGKVAVVDVCGDVCAVVGDRLAGYAIDNGWAGIILNGYLRDTAKLKSMSIAIRALGTHPRRSSKRADGVTGMPVSFGGVDFKPNAYLYADEDGVIAAENAFEDVSFRS